MPDDSPSHSAAIEMASPEGRMATGDEYTSSRLPSWSLNAMNPLSGSYSRAVEPSSCCNKILAKPQNFFLKRIPQVGAEVWDELGPCYT